MLSTQIGNIHLDTCLYNASGVNCTTQSELQDLAKCPHTGAVISKSSTLLFREGNPHPRYYQTSIASINSTGLANYSSQFYARISHTISKEKPFFISVSGLSLEDNLKIFRNMDDFHGISGIELNLSCPNIIGKPQTGYDFEATDELLRKVFEIYHGPTLGLKLPAYFDFSHFEQMAEIILKYPQIKFITCINSLGNGLLIDPIEEKVVIRPKNGFGGIGGEIIKPFALANVHKFYQLFEDKIDIIGCGGITSGMDAFEHILAGAKAVQIGTQVLREGLLCFERIENELKEIINEKGYQNIGDFCGKLQHFE